MRHQVVEQQAVEGIEARRPWPAVQREVVAELGQRVDVDDADQFAELVARGQPAQAGRAVRGLHVDDHRMPR
ncbi:hypothetical protein D3C86_1619360 [compost metagenome]